MTPPRLKIGSLALENDLVLAPLAGISNLPLRLLAKEAGCGLVCSEMISANALFHKTPKTFHMLESVLEERPLSIQIFGANPAVMAASAQIVVDAGADALDINFGCSVKKVVKTGAGVALMRTPKLAEKILSVVRKAVPIPLTIKIRSGWDESGQQAYEIARIAEGCGVDAISFHPRSATQGFGGTADWSQITRLKAITGLPVIGNGDIITYQDALQMKLKTGCDGIMVGRAAIGNPFIFNQILAAYKNETVHVPNLKERFYILRRYLNASVDYIGEFHACRMMRSRLCWFVKGLPHASFFRESIRKITTCKEAHDRINEFWEFLSARQEENDFLCERGLDCRTNL
jgi:tRNA-dihydrouridine synthase B